MPKSTGSRYIEESGAVQLVRSSSERSIRRPAGDEQVAEVAETFLGERLPERYENVKTIDQVTGLIAANRAITRVEDGAARSDVNKRTLQRLFERYVGVGRSR